MSEITCDSVVSNLGFQATLTYSGTRGKVGAAQDRQKQVFSPPRREAKCQESYPWRISPFWVDSEMDCYIIFCLAYCTANSGPRVAQPPQKSRHSPQEDQLGGRRKPPATHLQKNVVDVDRLRRRLGHADVPLRPAIGGPLRSHGLHYRPLNLLHHAVAMAARYRASKIAQDDSTSTCRRDYDVKTACSRPSAKACAPVRP